MQTRVTCTSLAPRSWIPSVLAGGWCREKRDR